MNSYQNSPDFPASQGWRWPAEWEPHQATWLSWPRADGISFPGSIEKAELAWIEIVRHLHPGERIEINVFNQDHDEHVTSLLTKHGLWPHPNIRTHLFPAYEPWCRDHGPVFLKRSGELSIVDWDYNSWGGKYPPFDLDDVIPHHVAKLLGVPCFQPGIVLEGGSIDGNGAGALLTTESCLLNPNRNPDLSKSEIEGYLKNFLGVTDFYWLGEGIVGDDTDGHVDDLSRFVDERTIVTIVEEDQADENYLPLKENARRLNSFKWRGSPFRVVALPTPGVIESCGSRLPASYANFYIGNETVLMPSFRHANDDVARQILQKLFPARRVVAVDALDLIWGLGAFHCVTQQQPRV